jgi:formimidoylglutamate deiminase
VTPEDQLAISAHLQVELLKHGITALVEFHYLHNQPDGRAYDDPAILSLANVEAALETGIGLTHVPVLYMTAGLDGGPLAAHQRRFGVDVEALVKIVGRVRNRIEHERNMATGLGAHSLRAVPPDALRALLSARSALGIDPFHIHMAEQVREVEDCRNHYGLAPVEWLLDNVDVDENWTLVHATHVTGAECARAAETGATVALCPTTEANLGDGIFPLAEFAREGGHIAVGSDSHVCVSPWEELRWLEYVQRLIRRERNVMAGLGNAATGTALIQHLSSSAAHVTGRPVGRLDAGYRADLVVLDDALPQFAGRSPEKVLDTAIFASNVNPVRHVMVGGRWCIRDGRHRRDGDIGARYRDLMQRFGAGM